MKKFLSAWIGISALFFAGCSSWDYEGTTDESFAADEPVVFFPDPARVPSGFVRLGSFTYTSAAGETGSEVRRTVREHALKHGANGILIREMRKIPAGEARQDQISNLQAPGWNKEDNSVTAHDTTVDTILYSSGSAAEGTIYKFEAKGELFRGPSILMGKP